MKSFKISISMAAVVVFGIVGAARAQATWDGGGADGSWGTSANWVGDTLPTFNNTLDLIFNTSGAGNLTNYLGADRTIRSLTFNADADNAIGVSFTANGSTGARHLMMGNATDGATITVASGAAANISFGSGANGGAIALASDLVIDHAGSGTLQTRSITGSYGVTKNGGGTWTTRIDKGINTYTGGLTVNAGTVNLSGSNSFEGGLSINGGSVVISNDSRNLAAWSGGVTMTGGEMSISYAPTYTGDTSIAGGRVVVNVDNALSSGALTLGTGAVLSTDGTRRTLANAVTLTGNVQLGEEGSRLTLSGGVDLGDTTRTITAFNNTSNANLATILNGVVSGSGGLVKAGSGILQLNGTSNTFTGDVTISEGTLQLRGQGSLGNTTQKLTINGGRLDTIGAQALTLANPVEIGGNFELSGASTLTLNGTMDLGGVTRTLTTLLGGDKVIDGVISNGGLTIAANDDANLFLGGDNTYTGATQVNSGGLIVGGSLASGSAVSVVAGARLGGDGTIAGNLTLDSGAFLVFDPSLSLTVSGTVALDNSFGVASLVKADGTAIDWTSVSDGTYTLLGATASTFDTITNFGLDQAKDIGDGRKAYFENGSLQLVVIPEPATLGLFMSVGGLVLVLRRWLWDRR